MHVYEMGVINMLNAEKYREEILENSNVVSDFSMSKDKHTIKKCLGVCKDCFFHEAGDHCSNVKVKWLLSEYKEPIKLTRLEYSLLRHVYKLYYKYIARDKNGDISLYLDEPDKDLLTEIWHGKEYAFTLFNSLFKFVKWEDLEPTSIQDVLDKCEVVESDL